MISIHEQFVEMVDKSDLELGVGENGEEEYTEIWKERGVHPRFLHLLLDLFMIRMIMIMIVIVIMIISCSTFKYIKYSIQHTMDWE